MGQALVGKTSEPAELLYRDVHVVERAEKPRGRAEDLDDNDKKLTAKKNG